MLVLFLLISVLMKLYSCFLLSQFRILALFRRLGNSMLKVKEVKMLLDELLNKRKQYYFGSDLRSRNTLSEIEIQTLCLLLEVNNQ